MEPIFLVSVAIPTDNGKGTAKIKLVDWRSKYSIVPLIRFLNNPNSKATSKEVFVSHSNVLLPKLDCKIPGSVALFQPNAYNGCHA